VVSFKTTLSLAEQLWVREYRTIVLTTVLIQCTYWYTLGRLQERVCKQQAAG